MTASELILNIGVNMGRLSRFAIEKRPARLQQFLDETDLYLKQLESVPKNKRVQPTIKKFSIKFKELRNNKESVDDVWAEEALTWSNILLHRAKIASIA